jgi:hypothetical protein
LAAPGAMLPWGSKHGERDAAKALPTTYAWCLDQIVSHDWYPKSRHGIDDDLEGNA